MTAVASKNLYELLGNDHEEDSDREPEPPVSVVDKTPARTDKRNQPREAPAAPAGAQGGRGGRRGGYSGNEAAFRDRNAGSTNNHGKPVDDGPRSDRNSNRSGGERGRGGRGGRGRGGPRDDRHSKSVAANSEKQAEHGWGANEGGAELADEQAGEAIAKSDEKEAIAEGDEISPDNAEAAPATEPEPEDNSISYAEYLAKLAEKKLALGGDLEIRKPNEGTKENKQWANAKPVTKDETEDFIAGSAGKAKRERERKQKQVVDIDQRFVEPPDTRGGRGGGGRGRGDGSRRGSRGDGSFRGSRGDGSFRGSRGDGPRGGRGRGDGSFRGSRGGPRGGASAAINTEDTNAFPSLGA